jgi:hypothetical protein
MWSILSECKSVIPFTPDNSSSSSTEPIATICISYEILLIYVEGKEYFFIVTRNPQRDGGTPIAVPGYRPVACVRQPVSEPVFTNVLRHPENKSSGPLKGAGT